MTHTHKTESVARGADEFVRKKIAFFIYFFLHKIESAARGADAVQK